MRLPLPPWSPLAAAALLQWLPLATAAFLPFVDLPQHIAQAQLLLHRGDPQVAALYELQLWPQVNVLALFVMAPALAIAPEAVAIRAVLALYVAGLALALYVLTRSLRTSPWGAVAALLFTVQFNLWYGFLSFCLGLPLLILLVARWSRVLHVDPTSPLRSRNAGRGLGGDTLLWFGVVLGHTLLFAFGIAAFALWVAWGRGSRRRLARGVAIIPALGYAIAWLISTRTALAARLPSGGGLEALWEGPGAKLAELGRALLVASQPGVVEWCVLGAAAIGAGWWLWQGRSRRWAARSDADAASTRAAQGWVRAVGALALAAYVLLPYSVYERDRVTYGLFIVYPRFAALAPLFVLPTLGILGSGRGGGGSRLGGKRIWGVAIIATHVALAVQWSMVLDRVGREAAPLDDLIAVLEPRRKLKSLIFTPYPAGLRYEGYLHVASYYQARALGETDQSFAALLPSPVHYRDPARPYLSLHDEHLRPDAFDPSRAALYDYLMSLRRDGPASSSSRVVFERAGWRVEAPRAMP